VYVQEIPSSVRPIASVSTSVGAFIDFFPEGDSTRAVQVFGMADFERQFGRIDRRSAASYQVAQFFMNGGPSAWIVRALHADAQAAKVGAKATTGTASAITLEARSKGAWGNTLRFSVEPATDPADPTTVDPDLFNLYVYRYAAIDDVRAPIVTEKYLGVSTDKDSSRYFVSVVNDASQLVVAKHVTAGAMPVATGTVGDAIDTSATFSTLDTKDFKVTYNSNAYTCTLAYSGANDLRKLRGAVEAAIRKGGSAEPALAGATVQLIGDQLMIEAAWPSPTYSAKELITIGAGSSASVVDVIGFGAGDSPTKNVQEYVLGDTSTPGFQKDGVEGDDGTVPLEADDLIGDPNDKTGIYALEDVDLFNILCIPAAASLAGGEFTTLMSTAVGYCEKRRAFMIVDIPESANTPQKAQDWVDANASTIKNANTAVYFPRVELPDPTDQFRMRSFPSSGTMAGIFARTDTDRGVWKAPAGIDTMLRGVGALDYILSDGENGVLNQLGINCLRVFPVYGQVAWGARTLLGADAMASSWKYISIRRLALMIEESLFRGTKWVVFEPNDEPLWAKIRQNVGAFMMGLFRQGAFQGSTPDKAFYVKCDGETTTAADRNLGVVNIEIGFAPLKPAEFVVLKIQQIPDVI
jgi:phage tail sheath protein FI